MSGVLQSPPEPTGSRGADPEQDARDQAIKQIERRRRFRIELVVWTLGSLVLILIWATSEYHNTGGWPTQGFSESSGIHDTWNYWIVYPLGAIVLFVGGRAWFAYGRRPISEDEIAREMRRQSGRR